MHLKVPELNQLEWVTTQPDPTSFTWWRLIHIISSNHSNGSRGSPTGSVSDQQSTNDRKVAGSRPTKVVCITVLIGNRLGWTARCGRPPLLPSCRKTVSVDGLGSGMGKW